MINGKIVKYSNYFTVLPVTPLTAQSLNTFFRDYVSHKLKKHRGRWFPVMDKPYAKRCKRTGKYHAHINTFDEMMDHFKRNFFDLSTFEITEAPMYKPKKAKISMPGWKPRKNQKPLIDFVLSDGLQKAITLQAGGGKTIIALFVAMALGQRFMVVTLGGWASRWAEGVIDPLGIEPEDFPVCCGAVALVRVLKKYAAGEYQNMRGIFISTDGLTAYQENYDAGKYKGIKGLPDVPPEKLCEYFGIGLKITDEVHRNFRANYIADLHTHCPKTLYLTATLESKDKFLKRMYETMMPLDIRREADNLNVYVEAIQVDYYLNEPDKAKTVGATGMYSHTTYEQWIMSDPKRLDNYLKGIFNFVLRSWLLEKLDGERIIIWTATIALAEMLTTYFKRRAPDLTINTFLTGDPYFILQDSDIIFSTLGKSGTAVDIADLTQAHMTTNISSFNTNIQALGRLREILDGPYSDLTLKFFYYICQSIPKHVEYAKEKKELFKDRVTKILPESLGIKV